MRHTQSIRVCAPSRSVSQKVPDFSAKTAVSNILIYARHRIQRSAKARAAPSSSRPSFIIGRVWMAGLVGVSLIPKQFPFSAGARLHPVAAVLGAVQSFATTIEDGFAGSGNDVAAKRSRSTRQGNDSFRMHA